MNLFSGNPEYAEGSDLPEGETAELLDALHGFVRRFVRFSSDAQAVAVALWVAHTWAFQAADTTPYLHVSSPEKRSGKTRLLEVLVLVARSARQAADMSAAAMFRVIAASKPSVLFDEIDAIFGRDADDHAKDIRAVLNAGYRLGGAVERCVGEGSRQHVESFPTFAPKVLAGIGQLPDTLADRCIPIRLQRRAKGERVERFRRRQVEPDARKLTDWCASWADSAVERLAAAEPALPEALNDRAQDAWEPLLAIADLAGGDWPTRARAAALELHAEEAGADESAGLLALRHCRDAFDDAGADRLATDALLRALVARDDAPWADWWGRQVHAGETKGPAHRLARLLGHFDIRPTQLRVGEQKVRGYARGMFTEAWSRYLNDGPDDGTEAGSPPSNERNGTTVHRRSEALFDGHEDLSDEASEQARTVVPFSGAEKGNQAGTGSMWARNAGAERAADRLDQLEGSLYTGLEPDDPRKWTR